MAILSEARSLLCALLVAVASLPACSVPGGLGDVQSSSSHSYSADTECQGALPFVIAYRRLSAQFEPQLEAARVVLNAATDDPRSRAALERIAATLEAYDSALATLPAPGRDAPLLSSAVRAGALMAMQARTLAAEPAGSRDVAAFDAAVIGRRDASRALSLRVSLLHSECR